MANTIITPVHIPDDSSVLAGTMLALIAAIAVGVLFFAYALPAIQVADMDSDTGTRIETNIPSPPIVPDEGTESQ